MSVYLIHGKNPMLIAPDEFGMVWKAWWIDYRDNVHYAESSNHWPIDFTEMRDYIGRHTRIQM